MFVQFSNSCNGSESGGEENDSKTLRRWSAGVLLPAATAAILANALMVHLLLRPRLRHNFGNLRIHFLILGITEIGVNGSFLVFQVLTLIALAMAPHAGLFVLSSKRIAFTFSDALLSARNWTVVIIAVSRCIAVLWPLQARASGLSGARRAACALAGLTLLSGAYSVLRSFIVTIQVCQVNEEQQRVLEVDSQLVNENRTFRQMARVGFFAFQRAIPTVVIVITTILLLRKVRSRRVLCDYLHLKLGQHDIIAGKVTRTVVLLMIVFCVFQFPLFLFQLLMLALQGHAINKAINIYYAMLANDLMLCLDSTANIFVLRTASKSFANELTRMLTCRSRRSADAISLSNQGSLTIYRFTQ